MIQYDPDNWRSHLFDVRGSMLREIVGRVTTTTLWAVLVVLFHEFIRPIDIPLTTHSLIGVVLGLLLVFRTNSSYDRFWEGRKLWGGIVNECRNLARSAQVHLANDPPLRDTVIAWTALWPEAAKHLLQGRISNPGPQPPLPDEDVSSALSAPHAPLEVGRRITACLASARDQGTISEYALFQIDHNVQLLIDYIGGCERIHRTPIPYAYMVHLRRALIVYCGTLPIALVGEYHWLAIPATLLVSYLFFGIEEIGVEIEDPFGDDANDLPLDKFCEKIAADVRGL
ncbi:MAG: bestrophin family protein [Pirellulales bacterium]